VVKPRKPPRKRAGQPTEHACHAPCATSEGFNPSPGQQPENVPPVSSSNSKSTIGAAATTSVGITSSAFQTLHHPNTPVTTQTPESISPSHCGSDNTPRKQALKRKLEESNRSLLLSRKRVKTLLQCRRRLVKKCASLHEIVRDLRSQHLVSDNGIDMLLQGLPLPEECDVIVSRFLKSHSDQKLPNKYPPALRAFALTLHFYSPSAYNYVRKTFNCCLPHGRTIRKWYSTVEGEPGLSEEAFRCMKIKALAAKEKGEELIVALMTDDVAIKQHTEYDGKRILGYVDLGTGISNESLPEAKYACVYMAVCLNERWKIPCSYYLIDSLTGSERAELTRKCLVKLYEIGVRVETFTFDGASSNITMANALGANLSSGVDNLKTSFSHPSDAKREVSVFLDVCHMMKLVRNCLADKGSIVDGDGNIIQWKYISELEKLQSTEGLRLGNKLTKAHIAWYNQKMKVKLAAQALSTSVADALDFCEQKLKLPQFSGAGPTASFIRIFDRLFDILNSRSPVSRSFKAPLRINNEFLWRPFLEKARKYIMTLRESRGGKLMTSSQRKTGFVGFVTCIQSVQELFDRTVKTDCVKYLLTYKISQDHLELFFGCIRQMGGCNNNPTVRQFKAAFKKLLVRNQVKATDHGNCVEMMRDVGILHCSGWVKQNTNKTHLDTDSSTNDDGNFDNDLELLLSEVSPKLLSEYVDEVVPYIAGFVSKTLSKTVQCRECATALFATKTEKLYPLIQRKSNGGLVNPSKDVVTICRLAEQIVREVNLTNAYEVSELDRNVQIRVMRRVVDMCLFNTLKDHINDTGPLDGHLPTLVKQIANKYVSIRLHHATKENNRAKMAQKVRSKLTRLVINKHQ
jgi:DNA transposase THAP9